MGARRQHLETYCGTLEIDFLGPHWTARSILHKAIISNWAIILFLRKPVRADGPNRSGSRRRSRPFYRKRREGETVTGLVFAHGITGIYLSGRWLLFDMKGNREKWRIWTRDETRINEMPVLFLAERDCLFRPVDRILIETPPAFFADRTDELVSLIERIDGQDPKAGSSVSFPRQPYC